MQAATRASTIKAISRPPPLSETVLNALRDQIVQGDLALGELLSERVLAERLGVSKTPVREALFHLRTEGLVRIVPQRGAFVFTLSAIEVKAICEFRQTLEAAALKLSVERNHTALVKDLHGVVGQMRKCRAKSDRRGYLNADTAFHAAFFTHSGNQYLRDTYSLHAGKVAALRTHLAVKPQHTDKSFEEHEKMAELIAEKRMGEAMRILDIHIERTKSTYSSEIADIAAADRELTNASRPPRSAQA